MNRQLFVSDLDHTLLNGQAELSDFSFRTLQHLLQQGMAFTVATARSSHALRKPLKGLPLTLPVIELNGGYITNLETGIHEHVQAIPEPVFQNLLKQLDADQAYFLLSFDGIKDHLSYTEMLNEGHHWYLEDRRIAEDDRLRPTQDLRAHLSEQLVCVTLIDRKEVLEPIIEQLSQNFAKHLTWVMYENQYQTGWFWLNIQDKEATKGHAVQRLLKRYNLNPEQLTVYGDQVNDCSMFQIAGRACAVANAVPELKALATDLIAHHEDDAVVKDILATWQN